MTTFPLSSEGLTPQTLQETSWLFGPGIEIWLKSRNVREGIGDTCYRTFLLLFVLTERF